MACALVPEGKSELRGSGRDADTGAAQSGHAHRCLRAPRVARFDGDNSTSAFAFLARFERQLDPERRLPEEERQRRARGSAARLLHRSVAQVCPTTRERTEECPTPATEVDARRSRRHNPATAWTNGRLQTPVLKDDVVATGAGLTWTAVSTWTIWTPPRTTGIVTRPRRSPGRDPSAQRRESACRPQDSSPSRGCRTCGHGGVLCPAGVEHRSRTGARARI